MPKLINLLHPYEFKKISCVEDFFVFSKNIFRIIQKKGCYEKKDGILVPLRWSKIYNCWVVDRGTGLQRDVLGISLDNIDKYFSKEEPIYTAIVNILTSVKQNKEFYNIGHSLNLIKNETKFIPFEYVDKDKIYPLGIFQFYQTKKRKGKIRLKGKNYLSEIVDDDQETLNNIVKCHKSFRLNKKLKLEKSYIDVNRRFITKLNKLSLELYDDLKNKYCVNINKEVINNLKFKHDIFVLSDLREVLRESKIKNEKHFNTCKHNIIFLLLCIELGKFLKEEFKMKDSEGFVVTDIMSGDSFKFTGDKILEQKISFKKNKSTNKEIDRYFFLPRMS